MKKNSTLLKNFPPDDVIMDNYGQKIVFNDFVFLLISMSMWELKFIFSIKLVLSNWPLHLFILFSDMLSINIHDRNNIYDPVFLT